MPRGPLATILGSALGVACALGLVPARAAELPPSAATLEETLTLVLADQLGLEAEPVEARDGVTPVLTSRLAIDGSSLSVTLVCRACQPSEIAPATRLLLVDLAPPAAPASPVTIPAERPTVSSGPALAVALTGVGLSLVALGAVLFVSDDRCATDRRDAAGACATLHDLFWPGIGLLAGGGLLAATGVGYGLWLATARPGGEAR